MGCTDLKKKRSTKYELQQERVGLPLENTMIMIITKILVWAGGASLPHRSKRPQRMRAAVMHAQWQTATAGAAQCVSMDTAWESNSDLL